MKLRFSIVFASTVLLLAGAAAAQVRNESAILAVPGVSLGRGSGFDADSVAVTVRFGGDTTVDGLYVFTPDLGSWTASPRLRPAAWIAGDHFGRSVAISGERIAVGAYNHDAGGVTDAGAAFVFERDLSGQWVEMETLSPLRPSGRFGNGPIDLDGDVLTSLGSTGINQSSFYVYERGPGGWSQAFVSPPEPVYDPQLAVSGDTLVLGLPRGDTNIGTVRIYQRRAGAWSLIQNFAGTGSGSMANNRFGRSVDVDGATVAFAANRAAPGEVRILRRQPDGLYQPSRTITLPAGLDTTQIELSGDRLAVLAGDRVLVYGRNVGGADAWGLEMTLMPATPGTTLGDNMSISGSRVVAQLREPASPFAPRYFALFDVAGPSSSVAVDLTGPACTPLPAADLLATVDSSLAIDRVEARVGSGPWQTLCIGCGADPELPFAAAPLGACLNTVEVKATDVLGLTAADTLNVRWDADPPVLDPLYCADRMVLIPFGATTATVVRPAALDACDTLITPTCTAGPTFPLGATATSCSRTDACGNVGSCSFTVTVAAEDGPPASAPACLSDDFGDAAIDPAWTLAAVGDVNQHSVSEGAGVLDLRADGSTAFYGTDNAGFLYKETTGDFRAEVTVDGRPMSSGGAIPKAGLMVRRSLDDLDVRLIAQLAPYWQSLAGDAHLQFVARKEYGGRGSWPIAEDVVGVPRVVRLAIERRGDTFTVFYSTDGGGTWTRPTTGLGGSITLPGIGPTLLVGLDTVSNNVSVTTTARFDDAVICPPAD